MYKKLEILTFLFFSLSVCVCVCVIEQGISTFGERPQDVADYLKPLLEFASSVIPPSRHSSTPLYLLATAGMRLLPPEQRDELLLTTCAYLQSFYPFSLPDCSEHVRVITGEEEGLYGWIAVNYLMDGFDAHNHEDHKTSTYGFLDMGGASTQIAFEPAPAEQIKHADNLLAVTLRLLSGRTVEHPVFVTTWLGFGTNQARERYIDHEIEVHESSTASASSSSESELNELDSEGLGSERPVVLLEDPCLPKDLMLSETRHAGFTLRGTGDFLTCVRRTGPLLNKEMECLDHPCLFNGVHVPAIDFSVNHFIGISEYWYSTQDVWSMGGVYDFVQFEKNAIEFCGRDWDDIMREHKSGLGIGWRKNVELSRLETQCFKAAWVINILHEGIGIPRLKIDDGGKGDDVNQGKKGMAMAMDKGLMKKPPSFQSLSEVGDVAVSWTLGKMVLEVSRGTSAGATDGEYFPPTSTSSWRDRLQSLPSDVPSTVSSLKNGDPILIGIIALLLVLVYFFCCSSRRRHVFFGGLAGGTTNSPGNGKRRSDFGLVSQMDESASDEDGASSSSSSNPGKNGGRRSLSVVGRLLGPLRWSALVLSSSLRRWSSSGKGGGSPLLPSVMSQQRPSAGGGDDMIFRPRPIRQVKSTPFLRAALPHASSSSPSLLNASSSSTTSHWNDAPDLGMTSSSILRSHSSSILHSTTTDSVPLTSSTLQPSLSTPTSPAYITPQPTSRPTTPSTRNGGPALTKLTRSREPSSDRDLSNNDMGFNLNLSPHGQSSVGFASATSGRNSQPGTPPANSWAGLDESGSVSPAIGVMNGGGGAKVRPSKSQGNLPNYFARRAVSAGSGEVAQGDD